MAKTSVPQRVLPLAGTHPPTTRIRFCIEITAARIHEWELAYAIEKLELKDMELDIAEHGRNTEKDATLLNQNRLMRQTCSMMSELELELQAQIRGEVPYQRCTAQQLL